MKRDVLLEKINENFIDLVVILRQHVTQVQRQLFLTEKNEFNRHATKCLTELEKLSLVSEGWIASLLSAEDEARAERKKLKL